MADTTRNIFSLSEYSDDTIAGDGIPVDSVFLTDGAPASAAYVTSGIPGYPSEFQKADMDTDTFTTLPSTAFPGPAGTNRVGYGAGSTKDAIWYVGGWATPGGGGGSNGAQSSYLKTPFATNTMTTVPGNLPSNRYDIGGTTYGKTGAIYFYAGRTYNNGYGSDNVKVMTTTATAYTLNQGFPESGGVGSVGGNGENGYIMGMKLNSPGNTSRSYRFSYTTESASTLPGGNLEHPGKATTTNIGTADSQYMAGFTGPGSTRRSYTQKLDFNTESTALVPSAPLTDDSSANGGIGNYTTHGYILGATVSPALYSGGRTYIQKLQYSTNTLSTIPAFIVQPTGEGNGRSGAENGVPAALPKVRWKDGVEATPNDGYSISGGSPTVSITDRLSMSTDSVARVPGMDSYQNTWMVGTTAASSTTKGYYGGEYNGGVSSIWNIVYSTNGREHNPSLNLSTGIAYYNSAGNANKGYVLGGYIAFPSPNRTLSSVYRMTYSSDSTSRIPGANIPAAPTPNHATGEGSAAFSSSGDESGAAYLTGGKEWPSQGNRSYIWKMSYPTETTSLLPARVPNTRTSAAAHSEKSAGYLTGGWTGSAPTSVLKFPWSTETFVEDGGDGMHRVGASTGNQQYAYVMGGISNTTGSGTSAIKKFEYSTSTSSQITGTLTGTPSTAPRQGSWGTGALTNNLPSVPEPPTPTPTPSISKETHTYGIFRSSTVSYSQKRDFTTGTTSTVPTSGNVGVAGDLVSDENAIYTNDWNTTGKSTKIPWATQAGTKSPNTWTTSVNPYWTGAYTATNMSPTKGYFTGGQYPSISPTPANGVGRRRQHIVFATGTGVNEGDKAQDYIYFAASSDSATRGYMYGGTTANGGGQATISYMNFATDGQFNTIPGTPSFTLAYNRTEAAAVGNKEKAFIAGTHYNIPGIPAQVSRMEKFTYATETRQTMPGLNTPYASNRDMSATGDQEKGYWGGSSNNPNNFVITYATETKSGASPYPNTASNSSPRAISQAQNAQPGYINVPVSVLQ